MKNTILFLALALLALLLLMAKDAHGQEVYEMEPVYEVPAPCAKYLDEIEKYDWDVVLAVRIMHAESKCSPDAVNRKDSHGRCNGSYGLLQLACIHKGGNKLDPAENIRMAYEIYEKAGKSFRPWSTFRLITK